MVIKEIKFFNPHKIAESGQAFRVNIIDDTHVELVSHGRYLQIASLGNNKFAFSCDEDVFDNIYYDYFDLGRDYTKIVKTISEDDTYLQDAAVFGDGIRILLQEKFETLISFIISQRRSIPAIKTSVERIAETFGNKIEIGHLEKPFTNPIKNAYYSFPTPEELSSASLEDISLMGVGYRAEYILNAVKDINNCKIALDVLQEKSNEELFNILTSMKGVGTKVANCTMLFGFGRVSSFPIDVWIQRILDKYYNGHFDTSLYPKTAGIMQQFMFYYERNRP